MSSQSKGVVQSRPLLRIGDLLWCREGRHSRIWWPAMVTYDPKKGVYFRTHGDRVSQYHVQYFGITAVRGWVYTQSTQEMKDPLENALPAKGISKKVRGEFDAALQEASEAFSLNYKQRKLRFIFSFGPVKMQPPKGKPAPQTTVSGEHDQKHANNAEVDKKKTVRQKKSKVPTDHSLGILDKLSHKHPPTLAASSVLDSPSLSSSQSSIPDEVSEATPLSDQPQQIVNIPLSITQFVAGKQRTSENSGTQCASKRRRNPSKRYGGHQENDLETIPPPPKKPSLDMSPLLPLPLVANVNVNDNGSEASAPSIASAILTPPSSCTGDPPPISFEFEQAGTLEVEETKMEVTMPTKQRRRPPATKVQPILGEGTCCICDEEDSDLLVCRGNCFRMFHLDCIGLMIIPDFDFVCDDCLRSPSECFACKKSGGEMHGCSKPKCTRLYHLACIEGNKLFTFEQNKGSRVSFTCALHSCARCTSIGTTKVNHYNMIQCILCPLALHRPDCLIAGCEILDPTHMICYQHLKIEQNASLYAHMNLNTCLECGDHGSVFCCDVCSAAYHLSCLDEDARPTGVGKGDSGAGKEEEMESIGKVSGGEGQAMPSSKRKDKKGREGDIWKCPNCAVHDLPTYGSMVMSKFARWRWWPGEVVFPNAIPKNILAKKPGQCMFVVKFCGSGDYGWTYHGRTIPYLPEEAFTEGRGRPEEEHAKKKGFTPKGYLSTSENHFRKACLEAQELYRLKKAAREARTKPGSKRYFKIKSNKYLVPRPHQDDDSHSIPCQCTPENPCNEDSICVNRASYFECSPDTCPVGNACKNQRMMKCQYANTYLFYTGTRGWGLKAHHDIAEGDFVIEYVGEILDTEMCKERLKESHENNTTNFYMLTLEPGLVIDASRKSNHARFINHSCDPNCETQKWTVKGETRIGIFARKDIPAGTELTFDYHLDSLGNDKKECLCGSKNCSGFLGLKLKGESHKSDPKKARKKAKPKTKPKRKHLKQPIKPLLEPEEDSHEDECFVCGDGGKLLLCDRKACSKAYHLPCIGRKMVPPQHAKWECPRHYCQVCQKSATVFCATCPVSFCDKHKIARFLEDDGELYCLENCGITSDYQLDSNDTDQP